MIVIDGAIADSLLRLAGEAVARSSSVWDSVLAFLTVVCALVATVVAAIETRRATAAADRSQREALFGKRVQGPMAAANADLRIASENMMTEMEAVLRLPDITARRMAASVVINGFQAEVYSWRARARTCMGAGERLLQQRCFLRAEEYEDAIVIHCRTSVEDPTQPIRPALRMAIGLFTSLVTVALVEHEAALGSDGK